MLLARTIVMVLCLAGWGYGVSQAQIHVGSFSGPVTSDELVSFREYMSTLTPATSNLGNAWAQGTSGEETKALGLVYEIGHDGRHCTCMAELDNGVD